MAAPKYHAELDFGYDSKPLKFTAVDLDRLLKRFNAEVHAEQERRSAAREYTYVEPNLKVEVK